MPATTMAPSGQDRTILSTLASSDSVDEAASWETIMASSLQWRGAECIGLACGNRRPVIAPGNADVGHDGRDLVVRERLGEWRPSVRYADAVLRPPPPEGISPRWTPIRTGLTAEEIWMD